MGVLETEYSVELSPDNPSQVVSRKVESIRLTKLRFDFDFLYEGHYYTLSPLTEGREADETNVFGEGN